MGVTEPWGAVELRCSPLLVVRAVVQAVVQAMVQPLVQPLVEAAARSSSSWRC